ncbi:MAG: hypothetical protein HPY65_07815 [Syntrophaceae bacterium]|nr:hypothetical protein [Syntrophaceae bacterium]
MARFDQKWLEGLTYLSSEKKKTVKDGRPVTQNIPTERPLAEADVLDWKDLGDSVVIVAGDGQKHKVSKGGKADAAADEKKGTGKKEGGSDAS